MSQDFGDEIKFKETIYDDIIWMMLWFVSIAIDHHSTSCFHIQTCT
jgi:hypothetical protein